MLVWLRVVILEVGRTGNILGRFYNFIKREKQNKMSQEENQATKQTIPQTIDWLLLFQ